MSQMSQFFDYHSRELLSGVTLNAITLRNKLRELNHYQGFMDTRSLIQQQKWSMLFSADSIDFAECYCTDGLTLKFVSNNRNAVECLMHPNELGACCLRGKKRSHPTAIDCHISPYFCIHRSKILVKCLLCFPRSLSEFICVLGLL